MIKKDALKYAIISLFLLNIGHCCRHKTPQYFSRSAALERVWFKEKHINIDTNYHLSSIIYQLSSIIYYEYYDTF